MVLGSTQPLREMSTRLFPGVKGGRRVRLTTLPPSCAVVEKSGNLNFLEPSGPLQACNGTALPLLCTISKRPSNSDKQLQCSYSLSLFTGVTFYVFHPISIQFDVVVHKNLLRNLEFREVGPTECYTLISVGTFYILCRICLKLGIRKLQRSSCIVIFAKMDARRTITL
jgi:hypothetical protein